MRSKIEGLGRLDISSGSSQEFNRILNFIGDDLIVLFNLCNENGIDMAQALNVMINDSVFLQKKIHSLETTLAAVQQTIETQRLSGYNVLYKSFYEDNTVVIGQNEQVTQDTKYGILTLQYQNNNRLPLQRFPRNFLERNINMELEIDGAITTTLDDPTLLNILDSSDSTFWIHTEEKSSAATGVTFSINIELPKHLLPSLTFNAISINPYPMYSLDLDDITYVDAGDDTEYTLPTFTTLENISETKFIFETITAKSIKFTFTQNNYSQKNNVKYFTCGLRGIDIEALNTTTEATSFITQFNTPKAEQYFLRVLNPEAVTLNGVSYEDAVTHELLLDKKGNSIAQFGSDISSNVGTVYIRTTLTKSGQTIPVLQGLKIEYSTKT